MSAAPEGSTHGHVVLRWLAEQPAGLAALRERVAREIGSAAQFHTCDTTGLSLDALLALLAERGKLTREGELWRSDLSRVCSDE